MTSLQTVVTTMGSKVYVAVLLVGLLIGDSLTMDVHHMAQKDEDLLFESFMKKTDPKVGAVTFAFAKIFQNHMVLQKSPQKANVYGFSPTIGQKVTLQLNTVPSTRTYSYETLVQQTSIAGVGMWNFVLDPFSAGVEVNINVVSGGNSLTLNDVIFGDVWICSGQSNMQMTINMIDGGDQEKADAQNYPNIRLVTINWDEATTPQLDVIRLAQDWTRPSSDAIGKYDWTYFSAVCWLFGKEIHKATNSPIGLIASVWGGTPIKAWSSPQALAQCGVTQAKDSYGRLENPSDNSVLWNSMIYPLLRTTIYGVIWYQGEADSGDGLRDKYNCSFPTMIRDWRLNFNKLSNGQTSASFPFGFVQLAPYTKSPLYSVGFSDIRWHQTADRGYVPNPDMTNVFMAVAVDLPDFNSPYDPIHPRYKKDIGSRLALSGLAVAYQRGGLFQGPLPTGSHITSAGIVLDYGNAWTLEIRVNDGFEVQCSSPWLWVAAPIISHTSTTVTLKQDVCSAGLKISGLRYLWNQSPCEFKKCAVYETSKSLPGPPFVSYADFDQFGNVHFKFDGPTHL